MPHAHRIIAGLLLVLVARPALGAEASNPDWPCVQRKVAVLTSAQFWDGPQVEGLSHWHDNPSVTQLIPKLSSRRVAIEDATSAIERFASEQPPDKRDTALTLLFAGLLQTMNEERSIVMSGIERFQQRQRGRAHEIERQGTEIERLKQRAASDEGARGELSLAEDKYKWDVRVFTERQQSLPLACEIPVLIEQRLFALGREIRAQMRD
jgi:hypothetical protein